MSARASFAIVASHRCDHDRDGDETRLQRAERRSENAIIQKGSEEGWTYRKTCYHVSYRGVSREGEDGSRRRGYRGGGHGLT